MNFKTIMGVVVTTLVVIVFVSAVIIPVVNSATTSLMEEKNNVTDGFEAVPTTESLDLSITASGSSITIGDYTVTIDSTTGDKVILSSDNFGVWVSGSDSKIRYSDTTAGIVNAVATSITISDSEYTIGEATGTIEGTIYYLVEEGDCGVYNSWSGVYFDADSEINIYMSNQAVTGLANHVSYFLTGSIEDRLTGKLVTLDNETPVTYDVTATMVYEYDEDGFYTITSVSMNLTIDGSDYSASANRFIAPIEYHEYTSDGKITSVMLGIVPMLMFLIPIFIIVRALGMGRD